MAERERETAALWSPSELDAAANRVAAAAPPQSFSARAAAPQRSIGDARRSVDYRKGGEHVSRCSRCHTESMNLPVVYDPKGRPLPQPQALAPLLLGNELLGLICGGCRLAVCRALVSIFPDEHAFPFVNRDGKLLPNPRCETCSFALQFSDDGRSVVCPQCDAQPPTL